MARVIGLCCHSSAITAAGHLTLAIIFPRGLQSGPVLEQQQVNHNPGPLRDKKRAAARVLTAASPPALLGVRLHCEAQGPLAVAGPEHAQRCSRACFFLVGRALR